MQSWNQPVQSQQPQEQVLAGILGAFLFALAGGVVWVILSRLGYISWISGFVAVVCGVRGYSFFARRESRRGVIIAVLMAFLVIVLAWYACLAWDVCDAYKEWYEAGEVTFTVSYFEAFRGAWHFLEEPEIAGSYFLDLGLGLVMCIVFGASSVYRLFRQAPADPQPASYTPQPPYQGDPSQYNSYAQPQQPQQADPNQYNYYAPQQPQQPQVDPNQYNYYAPQQPQPQQADPNQYNYYAPQQPQQAQADPNQYNYYAPQQPQPPQQPPKPQDGTGNDQPWE